METLLSVFDIDFLMSFSKTNIFQKSRLFQINNFKPFPSFLPEFLSHVVWLYYQSFISTLKNFSIKYDEIVLKSIISKLTMNYESEGKVMPKK